jgi:hypothetical protein
LSKTLAFKEKTLSLPSNSQNSKHKRPTKLLIKTIQNEKVIYFSFSLVGGHRWLLASEKVVEKRR